MSLKKIFEKGISFDDFSEMEESKYKEKTLDILNNIKVTKEQELIIKNINKEINVLVFAEIWCPDCIINVPVVKKICDLNTKINMKIVPRQTNEMYMEEFLVDGKAKIPTFVFMDGEYNILGTFIEVPQMIKDIMNTGNQIDIIVAKKKYRNGELTSSTIEDIIKVIK